MDSVGSWGNAWSRSLAVVWTPARKPGKVNRSTYCMGVNTSTLPLRISTQFGDSAVALEEWRFSAGVNKPLAGSRSASQLHFGMDFGRRYTELETLHTETNLRIHVGVTLTPFVKNLWLTLGCTIDAHEPAQPQNHETPFHPFVRGLDAVGPFGLPSSKRQQIR